MNVDLWLGQVDWWGSSKGRRLKGNIPLVCCRGEGWDRPSGKGIFEQNDFQGLVQEHEQKSNIGPVGAF